MSLKTLISSLIESVFTSKKSFISNQAMPNEQSSVITHSFSESTNFVAPSDGYVCLIVENSNNTWYRLSLIDNAIHYLLNTNTGSYFGSGWFAVKKGATIQATLQSGVSGAIKFISSVGGVS